MFLGVNLLTDGTLYCGLLRYAKHDWSKVALGLGRPDSLQMSCPRVALSQLKAFWCWGWDILCVMDKANIVAADALGPIPETIRSRSAQIRSCDPDRPIAFHKRRSRSAHQIEKLRNQTVYCQLNHDINHSLGNLELKLHGRDWMKNVRLMISTHDVTMGGVATSFMSVDTRASWPVQCTHTVFAHDTTRFGHAIFDRYVYVITVIENIQTVDTWQTMFQYMFPSSLWILTMVKLLIKWPIVVMKFLIQHRS